MTKRANKRRHQAIIKDLEAAGVLKIRHPEGFEHLQDGAEYRKAVHDRVRSTWKELKKRGYV